LDVPAPESVMFIFGFGASLEIVTIPGELPVVFGSKLTLSTALWPGSNTVFGATPLNV
jgi:hypothetical protein